MTKLRFRDEDLSALFSHHNVIEIHKCICCGEQSDLKLWTRTDHFPALRCGNCGFVFMNSQLDEAGLNDYYNNYLGKRRINNSEKMEQRAIQYQQDAQVLFDRGVVGGKLLDVGCNGGFFLSALGQRFERFGTEIDPEAIDFCRANFPDFSANVFSGVLESAKFDSSYFDVVTMRGVVEHIPSPLDTLSEVARILKPGGVLFICATPNVDSVAAEHYRENWSLFHPVQHLWHYSPKTLSRLLSKCGLSLDWQELPYIGTPYEDFLSDLAKFSVDIDVMRTKGADRIISPPFFGSMMSLIFKKTDEV